MHEVLLFLLTSFTTTNKGSEELQKTQTDNTHAGIEATRQHIILTSRVQDWDSCIHTPSECSG